MAELQSRTLSLLDLASRKAEEPGADLLQLGRCLVAVQQAMLEELFTLRSQWPTPAVSPPASEAAARESLAVSQSISAIEGRDARGLCRAVVRNARAACYELAKLTAMVIEDQIAIKHNLNATDPPESENDDETLGYGVGSIWQDVTAEPPAIYVCEDPASGEAVWKKITYHADYHIESGSDQIDGDDLYVAYVPTNYTPIGIPA